MAWLNAVTAGLILLAGLIFNTTAMAAPRVFGLFVGVAEYKYAKGRVPQGKIEDLGGAPNDIAALKATIEPRIGLARSVTLLNQDATRAAILQAFNHMVADAAAGDTLLFYYTGHGARVFDQSGKQLSGYSSTIVPYDARNPDLPASKGGDILDNELREMIAAASALGVNVVTIFDSCNSGTATRSPWVEPETIRMRFAPDLVVAEPMQQTAVPSLPLGEQVSSDKRGYIVHLAAAPDGKAAIERRIDDRWRGDFTEALVRTLNELPADASYRELLDGVKIKLRQRLREEANTRVMTDIRGEGALDQRFLGEWSAVRLLDGSRGDDGRWTLAAGSIAGVTRGSRYAGYATASAAREANQTPIATAIVGALDTGSATLTLDPGSDAITTPPRLFWRETAHAAGTEPLRILINGKDRTVRNAIDKQIADLTFARAIKGNPDIVLDLEYEPGKIRVIRADDDSTVTIMAVDDQDRLRAVLEQIARYHALLAMIGQGTPLKADYLLSDTACDGTTGDPIVYADGEAHFKPGVSGRDRFTLVLRNNHEQPLYPHIINLSAGYEVSLVATVGDNAKEDVLEPGKCWNWPATVSGAGRDYLILVLADRPIPGLQNLTASAIRGDNSAQDPLAALIQEASRGEVTTRGVPAGIWSVRALSYIIEGD